MNAAPKAEAVLPTTIIIQYVVAIVKCEYKIRLTASSRRLAFLINYEQ